MRIKGKLDAVHVGEREVRTTDYDGAYQLAGWYAIDDNLKTQLGPFADEETCNSAIELMQ